MRVRGRKVAPLVSFKNTRLLRFAFAFRNTCLRFVAFACSEHVFRAFASIRMRFNCVQCGVVRFGCAKNGYGGEGGGIAQLLEVLFDFRIS